MFWACGGFWINFFVMYISAFAALYSKMYPFGMTLVVWTFWVCVGADCSVYCLNCWHPWWVVVFQSGRRVHRFMLCQNVVVFPLVLYPPLPVLGLCVALFAVAEGWLLLDIGWFVLFLERCFFNWFSCSSVGYISEVYFFSNSGISMVINSLNYREVSFNISTRSKGTGMNLWKISPLSKLLSVV